MDFDDDMSGLQIEDLGEYFLQSEIGDSWKGFSLGYMEEEKSPQAGSVARDAGTAQAAAAPVVAPAMMAASTAAMAPTAAVATATATPTATATATMPFFSSPMMSGLGALLKNENGMDLMAALGKPEELSLPPAPLPFQNPVTSNAMSLGDYSVKPTTSEPMARTPLSIVPDAPVVQPAPQTTSRSRSSTPPSTGSAKRPFEMMEACSSDSCATIAPPEEDDRGFRKKSREKMRRQEVNVKFDELIDLLGLSNRVRKSAVLQEAVGAIKALKRERDELRRDRDRLQQEVSKLATCLQYTHLGSVAAANAVAMSQVPHPLAHHPLTQMTATNATATTHRHPLHVPCAPGGSCFPIGSTFGTLASSTQALLGASVPGAVGSSSSSSSSSATTTTSGTCVIAPKVDKPLAPAPPALSALAGEQSGPVTTHWSTK
ncbi:TPA: hypothetical protein N0F65_001403 [Lagenidium giganteum]|uniref:BHLH domain-containing protein n=1 Tax=Lagenidium giganteum TaxID=4803 RepID=A0AAV2YX70_9STRA|nr:TPA: hypothetical protein N0F65_001403 [Lagenidium giganteum]